MATEKRLIDATPLIDECSECMNNEWNKSVYTTWAEAEEDFRGRLLDAHTVDAVDTADFDEILYKLECLLCHATGGRYSKAGYALEDMCRMVTDYIEECCKEAVAEEAVHGRWVLAKPRVKGRNATYRCTACGKLRSSYYNDVFQWEYCPCGAKMDGDGNGT